MRVYRHTTTYPAFDHTSFNLEHRGRDITASLSLHVRYSWTDGGFWFGLRPEVEVHRVTNRHKKLREQYRDMKVLETCFSCGKQEWLGARSRDQGWERYSQFMLFCPECVRTKTLGELIG